MPTKTLTATEARVHFGELINAVTRDGDVVVVEKGGRPAVVVLSVDEYQRLLDSRARDSRRSGLDRALELGETLRNQRKAPLTPAEQILAKLRDETNDDNPDRLR